jgi:hypothetical protein
MGIFQVKTGDIGSLFGRSKSNKEKLTSKENEDEQSLVSLSNSNKKVIKKTSRKKKINAKFRRLQEDCSEADTVVPEYEPPKGFDFPEDNMEMDAPQTENTAVTDAKTCLPKSIDLTNSKCDTVSTLDESLGDESLQKPKEVKKNRVTLFSPGKKYTKELKDSSNAPILVSQDKSLGCIFGFDKQMKSPESKKSTKENKIVNPEFYPLGDFSTSDDSVDLTMSNFQKPFFQHDVGNIQFTCSEEYETENDENVEKVSSIGSNDFHQFVVSKMPRLLSKQSTFESASKSHLNEPSSSPMKKAAKSIAASLSSPVPQKLQSRMIPNGSNTKRPRHVTGNSKSSQITTESENIEPATLVLNKSPQKTPLDLAHSFDNNTFSEKLEVYETKTATNDTFEMESFSHPTDPIMWSGSSISSTRVAVEDNNNDDLIELIRISSRRSEDEASRKPDPSPKCTGGSSLKAKTFSEIPKTLQQRQIRNEKKNLPKLSSTSNPSGVPNNAILGSMLFRHAHSDSTMSLEQSRDPTLQIENDAGSVPTQVGGLDTLEVETVSSVTEDAGSFYHENFERWNNRASRAINNMYSTYQNAGAHLMRGSRRVTRESAIAEA